MQETTNSQVERQTDMPEFLLRPGIVEVSEALKAEAAGLYEKIKVLQMQLDPLEQRRNRINSILSHLKHALDWMPKTPTSEPEQEIPF